MFLYLRIHTQTQNLDSRPNTKYLLLCEQEMGTRTRDGYKSTLLIYNQLIILDIPTCTDVITNLMGQLKGLPQTVMGSRWPVDEHTVILNIPPTSMEGYLPHELPQQVCISVLNRA